MGSQIINRSDLLRKMKYLRIRYIITLLLFASLLVGCIHAPAPYRPNHWINSPIDLKSIADPPDQPLLQVIIVYGPAWDHHSALRLVCPGQSVLFWDPGGSYGTTLPEDVRSRDLIQINPPDLETYLRHIWSLSSVEVEVFEWDLESEYARELYDILLKGADEKHPAGRFATTTMGLFCSIAISDFLHRFATKRMTVPKSFFFPHNLAKVLYTQSPKRVLAFRRGKQIMYLPPE
jgi:hypothetical protein